MGFIVFEEEAFNYLDAQLENFVKRMDRIRERSEDKTMNKWLDTQDVCQTLNICPRTVQTLRDNGTLAYPCGRTLWRVYTNRAPRDRKKAIHSFRRQILSGSSQFPSITSSGHWKWMMS